MKPKEKAEELLDKYRTYIRKADVYDYLFFEDENFLSKQCALIAVDEVIDALPDTTSPYNLKQIDYWQQVKNEINN